MSRTSAEIVRSTDESSAAGHFSTDDTATSSSGVERLPSKLARGRDLLLGYFRPTLHAHGVTDPQWRVLRVLSLEDELDAGEIARRAFILPSSLSRILRDFTTRGLIFSWASDADGRRVMNALTKAGRRLVTEIEPNFSPIYRELERRYGVERLARLAEMLEEFADSLEDE